MLAPRRVPPCLMTSVAMLKMRMNDTGPLAMPPPASVSRELRIVDRFVPVPDPTQQLSQDFYRKLQAALNGGKIESDSGIVTRMRMLQQIHEDAARQLTGA